MSARANSVRYVSTRGGGTPLGFDEVLLAGLARDGGLYVPDAWPSVTEAAWRDLRGAGYAEIAARVMAPFVGPAIAPADLERLVAESYAGFRHPAVAPLKQIGANDWLMELFHGPTLAFKDYALQLVGRLFDHVLQRRGQRIAILGATSGDTGSAAIEACRDRAAIDLFMLYPHGRISEVQRRQMTTVASANVHTLAIEGTFDDTQDIVKALFGDLAFRDAVNLAAVNSINWARVMAQIVYYVSAALALGAPDRPVGFAVPTGNFGNVFAGYAARRMGLPIERLVVGSNRNDILARFFASGTMEIAAVEPSLSPSMDIQVSSNVERLLFELVDRDGAALTALMTGFRATGSFALAAPRLARAHELFHAARVDDAETTATIARTFQVTGELIDPHTAVGVRAAQACRGDPRVPMVSLATAHPSKFPDAVRAATGVAPALPPHLGHLMSAPERVTVLPNDRRAVAAFILSTLGRGTPRAAGDAA
ncbi:MAG TPA: threonine synthase [Candidatus Sulfotelmatobacter sp.]|nr:threonine synthase [Candidatus Sulfotelmatobacter sp.]